MLMIACAIMGLWARSQVVEDKIVNDCSDCTFALGGGYLLWTRSERSLVADESNAWWCLADFEDRWRWQTESYVRETADPDFSEYLVRHRIPGAIISVRTFQSMMDKRTHQHTISSWKLSLLWLTSPLAVLSAYLIHWTPRKRGDLANSPDAAAQ
jgi:hypothetical protein